MNVLSRNKKFKISENEYILLNLNMERFNRDILDISSKKSQVSIFSDYLKNYLFNSRINYYKKILFRNYTEVKNLFYDFQDPEWLNIIYLKNPVFFSTEVYNYFIFYYIEFYEIRIIKLFFKKYTNF